MRRALKAILVAMALVLMLAGCGATPAPTPTVASTVPFPEVVRISVEEAAAHQAAGTALILDVRGAQFYAEGHIPNSVSLPLADLESDWTTLPKARLIITVCT